MKYEYEPPQLKKIYENERKMKAKYGPKISLGMILLLNALEAATNAYDIKCNIFFYMEHLKGNLKEYYSLFLDKKKSKWRMLIQMLDENGKALIPNDNEKEFLKSIKRVKLKELSEHYGEY